MHRGHSHAPSPSILTIWLAALTLCGSLCAQTVNVPLNANFNGILHAGEDGQADSLTGFRSISDRALDFSNGVPVDALLAPYSLVATPGVLDIVHLGNRNTVTNGLWAFDSFPDGDNVGVQPIWLTDPDQTGPQTTVLTNPILLDVISSASFLFQISDGGGSFTVTLDFQSGNSSSYTLSGPDWFGGNFAGRDNVDLGNNGNNLNIQEQTIGLSNNAGEILTQVSFHSPTNNNGGVAILAMNVEPAPPPTSQIPIPLDYNFNGLVHSGEAGQPDNPDGYRSVSDRGLNFINGVPTEIEFTPFDIVDQPGVLDIVHLGNRNTVDGGSFAFDPLPDGDTVGIQPNWLTDVDQSGPQLTILAQPVQLDSNSSLKVLFQVSDGGGAFDCTMFFGNGASITSVMYAGDWFGGPYPAMSQVDAAIGGPGLHLEVGTVSLGAAAGLVLTGIQFSNRSNLEAGYAILAATVAGTPSCATPGSIANLGGGNGPSLTSPSTGSIQGDLVWNVNGATPNAALRFLLLGLGTNAAPLSNFFASCSGTVFPGNPTASPIVIDNTGAGSVTLPGPIPLGLCDLAVTGQYAELTQSNCPVLLSNALQFSLGN